MQNPALKFSALILTLFASAALLRAQTIVFVGGSGTGHYASVQLAVNALPSTGGEIKVEAGTYTGQATITKPNVWLIGQGSSASATVLTADGSNTTSGSDEKSATLDVTKTATGFYASNIQIQNTYTQEGHTQNQAVALFLYADKSVLRNVRLIGRQDTLFLGSEGCTSTTCTPARQYIEGSYIEGDVDFVFGDGASVFDTCTFQIDENQGSIGNETTLTAQNKKFTNYLSGYVLWHSTVNSNPATGMTKDYLGRPWSALSTVTVVDTSLQAPINAAGWIEFTPGTTNNLPTATYSEYGSTGPGAIGYTNHTRESHAIYLTSTQANSYTPDTYLAGSDGWVPTSVSH